MTARGELRWRKASRSNNTGGNCVEIACELAGWAVRDSKNPAGPMLVFGGGAFDAMLAVLSRGGGSLG